MMFDAQNRLNVFEDFRIDRTLKKHRKPAKSKTLYMSKSKYADDDHESDNEFTVMSDNNFAVMPADSGNIIVGKKSPKWMSRFFTFFTSMFNTRKAHELTIEQFFSADNEVMFVLAGYDNKFGLMYVMTQDGRLGYVSKSESNIEVIV